jgi:hypothetical protein
MIDDGSEIRKALKNSLDSARLPAEIPEAIVRRAKRRRIVTSFAAGAIAIVVAAGAVYGASTLTAIRAPKLSPAESGPICSRDQIEDITWELSDPVGTGASHPGVLFEVRVTSHDPGCRPTMYIELDDVPSLPPDGEGPDADEFRSSSTYLQDENPCFTTEHVAGDFLYTGEHTIEVGVACDPDEPWPHETHEIIRFDGDTHEQVETADDYSVVAEDEQMRVFAPGNGQPYGWCPVNAETLAAGDPGFAEDAVLLAAEEISGGLDIDDAFVDSELASKAPGPPDFARMITRACPPSLVGRTVLVTLHLPQVESASLGATTYFVSKESRGWVIWNAW